MKEREREKDIRRRRTLEESNEGTRKEDGRRKIREGRGKRAKLCRTSKREEQEGETSRKWV